MLKINKILILLLMIYMPIGAQTLDEKSGIEIILKNNISVSCFLKSSFDKVDSTFYYIPTQVHFETLSTGDKSYSMLIYKNENEQIEGGIMHWMLQWGLSKSQMLEANDTIHKYLGFHAVLYDAVMVDWVKGKENIEIIGNNELGNLLNESIVNQSKIPQSPYSKTAIAFKFNADQALKIEKYWQDQDLLKQVFVQMSFQVNFKTTHETFTPYIIEIQTSIYDLLN